MKSKIIAAIYARKSVQLKKGDTLNIQEQKCRKKLQYLYDEEEYDLSISYYNDQKSGKNMDREEMQKMISQIKSGKIQAICVYKLDRLGRSATDLLNFVELLKEYKVKLYCVDDKIDYDPTDESDFMTKFLIMFLSLMAEMERMNIKQRVEEAKEELSKMGYWLGGTSPYGFETEKQAIKFPGDSKERSLYALKSIASESEVIKFIFDTYEDEMISYMKLANRCDEMGFESRNMQNTTVRFDQRTIQGMLENPVYVRATPEVYDWLIKKGYKPENISPRDNFDGIHGLLTYGKTYEYIDEETKKTKRKRKGVEDVIVAVSRHEGLIDAEQWLNVQEKMEFNRKEKSNSSSRRNNVLIPSNRFRCACCGGTIASYNLKSKVEGSDVVYPKYRCETKRKTHGKECNVPTVSAIEVDEMILDKLFSMKNDIADIARYIKANLKEVENKIVVESVVEGLTKQLNSKDKELRKTMRNFTNLELDEDTSKELQNILASLRKEKKDLEDRIEAERKKVNTIRANCRNLDKLSKQLLNLTEKEFESLDMSKKISLVSIIVKRVEWDGHIIKIYPKNFSEVCGLATDFSFFLEGLTIVARLRLLF